MVGVEPANLVAVVRGLAFILSQANALPPITVTAFMAWLIIDAYFKHEPNICSREYRDIYLETHNNDDELGRTAKLH